MMKTFLHVTLLALLAVPVSAQMNTQIIPYRHGEDWGYADTARKILLRPQYEVASFFNGGSAPVRKEGLYALINTSFKAITAFDYDEIYYLQENMYGYKRNYKYGIMNAQGKELTTPQFDALGYFNEGHIVVRKDSLTGLYNQKGQEVIPVQYKGADVVFSDGYFLVATDTDNVYLNAKNKPLALSWEIYPIVNFSEGLAPVYKLTEYQGAQVFTIVIINTKGEIVAEPVFSDVGNVSIIKSFSDGMAVLSVGGSYMWMDTKGKLSETHVAVSEFKEGIAQCNEGSLSETNFIDKNFNVLFSRKIEASGNFYDGLCPVQYYGYGMEYYNDYEDFFWVYVDKNGIEAIDGEFEDASNFENGFATVTFNGQQGVIDRNGKRFWE
jgi:WG containing repeat